MVAGLASLVMTFPTDRLIGAMFESEGQLERAIEHLTAWSEAHPADYDVRWHTADVQLRAVEPERAIATLEAMADRWPADTTIVSRLIEVEDSLLLERKAGPRLEALAARRPDDEQITQHLVDYYRWFGPQDRLLVYLRKLTALGEHPDETSELAKLMIEAGEAAELVDLLEPLLEGRPRSVVLRHALAQAAFALGRDDEGLAYLEQVLELVPNDIRYVRALIGRLMRLERYGEAIAVAEARLDSVPGLERELRDLRQGHAVNLAKAGRIEEAADIYRRFIVEQPTEVSLRLELAALYGKRASKVAIRELKALLDLDPSNRAAWIALADRLGWLGKRRAAVKALERARRLSPGSVALRRRLARELVWVGAYKRAVAELVPLVDETGDREDRVLLTEAQVGARQYLAAHDGVLPLIKASPNDEKLRRLAMNAALGAKRCKDALPHLRWFTTHASPSDAELWGLRGLCAKEAGNGAEAVEALKTARRLRKRGKRRRR